MFTVVFQRPIRNVEKSIQKSTRKILAILAENPNITTSEIAKRLNVTRNAVAKQIAKLKKEGTIKRVGADKGGWWQIITPAEN